MEKEKIISGRFVTVHLPSFDSCNPDLLTFSIFDDKNFGSLLPKPYITVDESFGFQQQQVIDPDQFDKFATTLEMALNNVAKISPYSNSKKPLRPYEQFTRFKGFEVYQEMGLSEFFLLISKLLPFLPSLDKLQIL